MTQFIGRFTDDQIEEILTSPDSDNKIAKRFGISRSSVGQIRTGKTYKNACPEIRE